MRRLLIFCLFSLVAFAQDPSAIGGSQGAQQVFNGFLYANAFGTWSVPQGDVGQFTWSNPHVCENPTGVTFNLFSVGLPIKIIDADVTKNETTTITAVVKTGFQCSIVTAPLTFSHFSFRIVSGTLGLQEALNYAIQRNLNTTVFLTNAWTMMGGTTGMITSAVGNANIGVADERSPLHKAYAWNGSAYIQQGLGGFGITNIDGVPIGQSVPAAGSFTTGTFSSTLTGLGDNLLNWGGSLNAKRPFGTRAVTQFPGADIGAQANASKSDLGTPCGRSYIDPGAFTFATAINFNDSSNCMIDGAGGVTAGAPGATSLIWSGTGTPISLQSTIGAHVHDVQFLWSNSGFLGPFIALGHSGSGGDSSGFDLHHFGAFKSGSGATAPVFLSLDKANSNHIHDGEISNSTVGIQGAASGASYSNANVINNIVFYTQTAIASPWQAWTMLGTTHELSSTSGNKVVDCSVSLNSGTAFTSIGIWTGDDVSTVPESLFDSCAVLQVINPYISGVQTQTTAFKLPLAATFSMSGGDFNNLAVLVDATSGNARVDVGPHVSNNVTTEISGTPIGGRFMLPSGATNYWGTHDFKTGQIRTASGTASAPGLALDVSSTTGWFLSSNGRYQFSYNGTPAFQLDNTGTQLGSGQAYQWSSNVDPNSGTFDTRLSRPSAGVVSADTTTNGNALASLKASNFISAGTAATLSGTGACATRTTQSGGASAGQITCTGTTGASTLTITPGFTATNGWSCFSSDVTHTLAGSQSGVSTTACTVSFTSVTANDVITFGGIAF